jgi:hypothetical protein
MRRFDVTTWSTGSGPNEARLSVRGGVVRMTKGSELSACEVGELRGDALFMGIMEAFGAATVAEVIAAGENPEEASRACAEPVPRRPHHRRVFGGGRGGSWVAWVFGKQVRLSADALDDRPDLSFEHLLERGLPEAFVEEAGAEQAAAIMAAVRELAPLECMCGTGAETMSQHGSIVSLSSVQEPRDIMEHVASTGRCSVCSRWWTFVSRGDSHYSYSYRVSQFDPTR